jgi:hypothetical protein
MTSRTPLIADVQQRTDSLWRPQVSHVVAPDLQQSSLPLTWPQWPHKVTSASGLCVWTAPAGVGSAQPPEIKKAAAIGSIK